MSKTEMRNISNVSGRREYLEVGLFYEYMAGMNFTSKNLSIARFFQERANAIWRVYGYGSLEGQGLHNLGFYFFCMYDCENSITAYKASLSIRSRLCDREGEMITNARLAEVHQHLGDHTSAINLFELSIAQLKKSGDSINLGVAMNNAGLSYFNAGNTEKAEKYFKISLDIRRRINDLAGMAVTLNNLGDLYIEQGRLERAYQVLMKGYQIRKSIGDRAGLSSSALVIGKLYEVGGDDCSAILYYNEALHASIHNGLRNDVGEAVSLMQIGRWNLKKGKYIEAINILDRALFLFAATGMKGAINTATTCLELAYDHAMKAVVGYKGRQGHSALNS